MSKGKTGAKRQSWENANPRAILEELVVRYPGRSKDGMCNLFELAILRHPQKDQLIHTMIVYWHSNAWNSLMDDRSKVTALRITDPKKVAAKAKAVVEAVVEAKARQLLLDVVTPNGKPLKECSGKELTHMGSWMSKIGAAIKPNQIVGKVLNEAQVRRLSGRLWWLGE